MVFIGLLKMGLAVLFGPSLLAALETFPSAVLYAAQHPAPARPHLHARRVQLLTRAPGPCLPAEACCSP